MTLMGTDFDFEGWFKRQRLIVKILIIAVGIALLPFAIFAVGLYAMWKHG